MGPTHPENTLGDFLRTRREQVQPEQVGLMRSTGRRVPGLRREEVADLAGVSLDYYHRLEQGKDTRPSDQVVAGLARALLLDHDSRRYLAKLAQPRPFVHAIPDAQVSETVAELLAQWSHMPAHVGDANLNVLAANPLAHALAPKHLKPGINQLIEAYSEHAAFLADAEPTPERRPQEEAWEAALRKLTAAFRFNADPIDPGFRDVVGHLSAGYSAFRRIWALHEAKPLLNGKSMFEIEHHGWCELHWQTLDVPGPVNLFVTVHFAAAGSRAAQALEYLTTGHLRTSSPSPRGDDAAQLGLDELSARRATTASELASDGVKTRTASSS